MSRRRRRPAQTQEERDYAAKKAIAEESARTKTAEEEKEWEAEVEEAKRLHDEEGLSAADAVAKAHSEAIWLKEQKTKLEHEAAIKESDEKWKKAEEDETKRLMKQEGLDWKAASAKAHSEAEWERQQEKEKIELKEQMDKAEGEKKAAVQTPTLEPPTAKTSPRAPRAWRRRTTPRCRRRRPRCRRSGRSPSRTSASSRRSTRSG